MRDILEKCNKLYRATGFCPEGKFITCPKCVQDGFYSESDDYFCPQKHYYYVMNYGPSYASEIYHYLNQTKILENNFTNKKLRVLSLGCGFAPDLLALNKYIEDNRLFIDLEYIGIDESKTWQNVRRRSAKAIFIEKDVLTGFDFIDINIVFIIKLFSTLIEKGSGKQFLSLLQKEIKTNLEKDSFLIFNEINHEGKGRDTFDLSVNKLFRSKKYFYFDKKGERLYRNGYTEVEFKGIVFEVPNDLSVPSKMDSFKNVIFEYKK